MVTEATLSLVWSTVRVEFYSNNKQMNLSEKDFMARSRSMTQELAKAEQDLAKQSSLGNERSQRIASEIIDQLTTKKMEALDKDYMGIKKNKTEKK